MNKNISTEWKRSEKTSKLKKEANGMGIEQNRWGHEQSIIIIPPYAIPMCQFQMKQEQQPAPNMSTQRPNKKKMLNEYVIVIADYRIHFHFIREMQTQYSFDHRIHYETKQSRSQRAKLTHTHIAFVLFRDYTATL